jgi:streptogramin lyase
MMRRRNAAWAVVILGAALGVWACGSSSDPGHSDIDGGLVETDTPVQTDADATGGETDAPAADAEVVVPTGGAFQTPCIKGTECASGFCVPSAEGSVCSRTCVADCPDGWSCRSIANPQGDPTFICVDVTASLCHPCGEDADCNTGLGTPDNRCVSFGDAGSFCGLACDLGGACPAGTACQEVEGGKSQCLPAEGAECTCNSVAKALALRTDCAVSNDLGSCRGTRSCGPSGLSACGAATPIAELCNAADDNCNGQVDEGLSGEVCENTNAFGSCVGFNGCVEGEVLCLGQVPAAEICNQQDDDCDGDVDEGLPDTDNDGSPDCVDDDDDDDTYADDVDCAPLDPAINPGAAEACNGSDDDCDGKVDEQDAAGCSPFFRDVDGDGFGADGVPARCLCGPDSGSFFTVVKQGDCNDLTGSTHEGAAEQCNGLDDDCDGETDEGTDIDTDGDGEPDCVDEDDDGDGFADSVDCAPLDKTVFPGAVETCDAEDDDCDGQIDEPGSVGCTDRYKDADGDGEGAKGSVPSCLCAASPSTNFTSFNNNDCNDLSDAIYSGATELCNGIDENCNGLTDEGTGGDNDNDGVADCVDDDDDNDTWKDAEDCAPLDATIFPGASESCNGVDDDCDGLTDEPGASGCVELHLDADGDGFGAEGSAPICACAGAPSALKLVDDATDCDDTRATSFPSATEVCNFRDDNCDGSTDEGVASPCGTCSPTCVLELGEEGAPPLVPGESSKGVVPDENGGITLGSNSFDFPFIWIANSAENTVSKLNTVTGCEAARYSVCLNPSRTAVDLEGAGIVACRDDGKVAKIAVIPPDCIDKNGNGTIETSTDLNGDCEITPNEMVSADECVLWVTIPDKTVGGCSDTLGCARAAGVDSDNNVWVGLWSSMRLSKLDGKTGAEIVSFPLTGNPYGLAIDGDGTIWVATRAPTHDLIQVDPLLGEVAKWPHPSAECYGLAVDPYGKVWVAGGAKSTVARFDPVTQTWKNFTGLSAGNTRGVAVRLKQDAAGQLTGADVYVGHHNWANCSADGQHRYVEVFDALTLTKKAPIDLGGDYGPVGVAIDRDGMLWSVNQCTSTATRVNPDTTQIIGNYPVGMSPYTYSDMTGYALKTITTPVGFHREVFTGWVGSQTRWSQLFVSAELPGEGLTHLSVEYRIADLLTELSAAPWQGPFGPYPPASFPLTIDKLGNYMEVRLTLATDDDVLKPVVKGVSVLAFEVK